MEADKILEALSKYRDVVAVNEDRADTVDEKKRLKEILAVLSSPILPSIISSSQTVIIEYGDDFYSKLSEPQKQETIQEILFIIAAFAYEGAVNGIMMDEALNEIINTTFIPSTDKVNKENIRALSLPRIALLMLRDKHIEYCANLSNQKKNIENYANTAAAKAKENLDTLTGADENLKEYLKKATGLKSELGFLVLSKAFTSFIEKKEKEIETLLKALKRMGALLLAIPILAFMCYQILPFFKLLVNDNSSAASAVQVSYSSTNTKGNHATPKTPSRSDTNLKPTATVTSGVDWPGIVNRLLNFLPIAVAELILLFYFRIILANYNSANAQLLQLKMRQSVCQFIEDYIAFKRDNKIEELEKFDSLIFSNLMPSAEQIPATFEGLEHLGKILGEFKPGK